jgi:NAD(P)-dependent dehydrogenase (short-subunit alcohol dehydrogenase family)
LANSIPHGAGSTANQVLAGIDLSRRHIVITGCNGGIGFETMSALAANGAHVIGLARSFAIAKSACSKVGRSATPVACDLSDLDSVTEAAATIRALQLPLDAIITNAAIANPPTLRTRYGIELQFLVNHISHFSLVNQLLDVVRDGSGRVVIVSSSASIDQAPAEGIMFDNLDGHQFYEPFTFYGQSKLATALYAKELSHRLRGRGIAVNSVDPGATKRTGLNRSLRLPLRMVLSAAQLFMKSPSQGAATQALLAASPRVAGITGEHWADCQIARGSPHLYDVDLVMRLWEVSAQIVAAQDPSQSKAMQTA